MELSRILLLCLLVVSCPAPCWSRAPRERENDEFKEATTSSSAYASELLERKLMKAEAEAEERMQKAAIGAEQSARNDWYPSAAGMDGANNNDDTDEYRRTTEIPKGNDDVFNPWNAITKSPNFWDQWDSTTKRPKVNYDDLDPWDSITERPEVNDNFADPWADVTLSPPDFEYSESDQHYSYSTTAVYGGAGGGVFLVLVIVLFVCRVTRVTRLVTSPQTTTIRVIPTPRQPGGQLGGQPGRQSGQPGIPREPGRVLSATALAGYPVEQTSDRAKLISVP